MIIHHLSPLRLIPRLCFLVLVDKLCEDKISKLNSTLDNPTIKYYDEMSPCTLMTDLACINAPLPWVCISCGGSMVVNKTSGTFRFLQKDKVKI